MTRRSAPKPDPASKPSAAALRSAAPVSDALYAASDRGLPCTPIKGEWSTPIDNAEKSAVRHSSKVHFLGFRFLLRQDGQIGVLLSRWASRLAIPGVRYIKLTGPREQSILPLAAAWVRGSRDPARDALLSTLRRSLSRYAAEA